MAESGTPHLTEKDIRLCLMSSACRKSPATAGLFRQAELSTYVQSVCYRSLTNHSSWKIMSSTSPQQRSFSLIRCASLQNCSLEQYMHRQAGSCTKKSNKKVIIYPPGGLAEKYRRALYWAYPQRAKDNAPDSGQDALKNRVALSPLRVSKETENGHGQRDRAAIF